MTLPVPGTLLQRHQMIIWQLRSQGKTYVDIKQEFSRQTRINLSNDVQIVRALRATALGYPWTPNSEGGRPPYLCMHDELILVKIVTDSARDLNSIPKWVLLNLAHEMKIQRVDNARCALIGIDCAKIAEGIPDPDEPDDTWVNALAKRHNLRIKNSEELAEVRKRTCDRNLVWAWFKQFEPVIRAYHPSLVFNMDETGVSSNRKYKVVVPDGASGIVPGGAKHQHITGIVCYNPYGQHPKPGIILSQLKNLPADMMQFVDNADFYSSPTGWITSDVFAKWAVNFARWVNRWRAGLDPLRKNRRVLLLMDGHTSRRNLDAIHYLWQNRIDVLTFPGHCTHVMQPFDVGVASPLKARLRQEIHEMEQTMGDGRFRGWTQAAVKRYTLVASFLESFAKAVTPLNARSSFRATGIYPWDLARVLLSRYLTMPTQAQCLQEWQNSMYIGEIGHLKWMANQLRRLRNDTIVDLQSEARMLMPTTSGILLTPVTP